LECPGKESTELVATVIAGLYGSDWSGSCWGYIQSYTGDPLNLCLSVLSEVEKVLEEILGRDGDRWEQEASGAIDVAAG